MNLKAIIGVVCLCIFSFIVGCSSCQSSNCEESESNVETQLNEPDTTSLVSDSIM